MKRTTLLLALLIGHCAGTADASGTLDPSFADTGIRVVRIDSSVPDIIDKTFDGLIDGQGRYVSVGEAQFVDDLNPYPQHAQILRHRPDGGFDETFAGSGVLRFRRDAGVALWLAAVAQQESALIVGGTSATALEKSATLCRVDEAGAVDAQFGEGGCVDFDAGAASARLVDLQVLPDLKILALVALDNLDDASYAIARFGSDGAIDTSFGEPDCGCGYFRNPSTASQSKPVALAVDPATGHIAVADALPMMGAMIVSRFTSSGEADKTFNGSGLAIVTFDAAFAQHVVDGSNGTTDVPVALAFDQDGNILVAGTSTPNFADPQMARSYRVAAMAKLLPDGKIDAAFGNTGVGRFLNAYLPPAVASDNSVTALHVAENGSAIIAGGTRIVGGIATLAATRVTPTGQVDRHWASPSSYDDSSIVDIVHAGGGAQSVHPTGEIAADGTHVVIFGTVLSDGNGGTADPFLVRLERHRVFADTFD